VDQFDTNQATVTWKPPSQPNGIITGYQVIYSVYQSDNETMSEVLNDTTTMYLIENLSKQKFSILYIYSYIAMLSYK